jgi:hypothetical protein
MRIRRVCPVAASPASEARARISRMLCQLDSLRLVAA